MLPQTAAHACGGVERRDRGQCCCKLQHACGGVERRGRGQCCCKLQHIMPAVESRGETGGKAAAPPVFPGPCRRADRQVMTLWSGEGRTMSWVLWEIRRGDMVAPPVEKQVVFNQMSLQARAKQ